MYEIIIKLQRLKERAKLLVIKNDMASRNYHSAFIRYEKEPSHAAKLELELRQREQDAAADSLMAVRGEIASLKLMLRENFALRQKSEPKENFLTAITQKNYCLRKTARPAF